jgi:hypothetical protein
MHCTLSRSYGAYAEFYDMIYFDMELFM